MNKIFNQNRSGKFCIVSARSTFTRQYLAKANTCCTRRYLAVKGHLEAGYINEVEQI